MPMRRSLGVPSKTSQYLFGTAYDGVTDWRIAQEVGYWVTFDMGMEGCSNVRIFIERQKQKLDPRTPTLLQLKESIYNDEVMP